MNKAIVMMMLAGAMMFSSTALAQERSTVTSVGDHMFVVVTEGGDRIDLYEIKKGKIRILDAIVMEREDVRHSDLPDYIIRNIEVKHKE